jgi:hypothetical protein
MRDIINVSSEGLADEIVWLPEEDQAIQQFRSEILAAEEFDDKKRRARARSDANLQRAFNDLLPKLKRAYGQPARDEADARSRHVVALQEIAGFLNRMGPDYLAHFADQFAMLAQALQDLEAGIRSPLLTPALANRGDQTAAWLARVHVVLAVKTMTHSMRRRGSSGHSRQEAAEWVAKRCPDLKQLITEGGPNMERSKSLERAIISWCEYFHSNKIKNLYAARVYSVGLDRLKAWAPNCNRNQIEAEADRLLREAVTLVCKSDRK